MMSQQRNAPASASTSGGSHGGANAIGEGRILDAAYDLMLATGLKRMTMAEIARRAGVSRATLYRRWSNAHEVVGTLLTRELDAVTAAAFDDPLSDDPLSDDPLSDDPLSGGHASARARLVDGIVRIAARVRTHPLLRKIIELDPEFLMPYLLERRGTSTDHQLGLIEAALRVDADDPSLRAGEPRALAETVLLTTWSFVLTGPVLTGPDGADRLDGRLYDILDRYLAP
ncbi:MAG: TetR/AcrR family transcriptional regulator [Nocardioidaceae bacterium]